MSVDSQTEHPSTAVKKGQGYTKNFARGDGNESFQDWKRDISTCMEDSEYFIDDDNECECVSNDDNEASMQQFKQDCTGNATMTKHERVTSFFDRITLHLRKLKKLRILTIQSLINMNYLRIIMIIIKSLRVHHFV
jgi:hypothetical protein